MGINVEGRGDAVQVPGLRVTGGFFSIVGVQPLMGRSFWQRRFGGHCDVVG
jgi:hypothetical protein